MLAMNETIIHFRGAGLGQSALHWSAAKGHTKAVRWLLDKGARAHAGTHGPCSGHPYEGEPSYGWLLWLPSRSRGEFPFACSLLAAKAL